MLFGIEFFSPSFGYAYGTGGTVLFTNDGGDTWDTRHFGNDTILVASFADPTHGLLRTAPSLLYLDGSDSLHQIAQPADTLQRFPFTPFLVTLSPDKMTAVLSEGPYSEGGFLSTIDGGKLGPSTTRPAPESKTFCALAASIGLLAMRSSVNTNLARIWCPDTYSDDGTHWTHTTNEFHPCHWEYCVMCNSQGCLGSGTLLVDFFHERTTFSEIPKRCIDSKVGRRGRKYLYVKPDRHLRFTRQGHRRRGIPGGASAQEQTMPRLVTKPPTGALRCLLCSLEPVFIDDKVQGRVTVHIMLQVGLDGTVEMAKVEKSPSDALTQKIHDQIMTWPFEPPTKESQPIRVKTESDMTVNVVHS